jgi:hypothetical protein
MRGKHDVDAELSRSLGLTMKEIEPILAVGDDPGEKQFMECCWCLGTSRRSTSVRRPGRAALLRKRGSLIHRPAKRRRLLAKTAVSDIALRGPLVLTDIGHDLLASRRLEVTKGVNELESDHEPCSIFRRLLGQSLSRH